MEESQKLMKVHVYYCHESDCMNQPVIESDEMRPEWFDFDKIPFNSMWPDGYHYSSFYYLLLSSLLLLLLLLLLFIIHHHHHYYYYPLL